MHKNLAILLLGVALMGLVLISSFTIPGSRDQQKILESTVTRSQAAEDPARSSDQEKHAILPKPKWQVMTSWPEGVTAIAVLLTLFFIAWQALLMRQTVSASDDVSKRELRAYLAVVIGEALYQERRDESKGGDLKFECRPIMVNTGRTPARSITFRARAAILPAPLPREIHLPEEPDEGIGGNILGSQQSAHMTAVVDGFCADKEVEDIKHGVGDKALYVWGRVTYEDVFGDKHFTRFCQHIYWELHGAVRGHYIPGRNDAD